ncbi:MAG: SGNH/GDSL hydrolase family protein [Candidatus Omnitrophota bacterium]|nr:SGNH/GDSL hydrolase family protein [Candidatus Omnitrophota bacterium]MDZ4242803.1 SGNH/GDSL hydrolase family protein [Candidatus Omnitrophota bacterium]
MATNKEVIRYIALGDSYTIGTGVALAQAWPVLLTQQLVAAGINIHLVANLARDGWATQEIIDNRLPYLKKLEPDFATVLIGMNDWVWDVDPMTFVKNFSMIVEVLREVLPGPGQILVLTVPDVSVTPAGKKLIGQKDGKWDVAFYNTIIADQCRFRDIHVIDFYKLFRELGDDPFLWAPDGLNPSAAMHRKIAEQIFPIAKKILTTEFKGTSP